MVVGSTGEICLIETGDQGVFKLVRSATDTFLIRGLILDSDYNWSATLVSFLYSSIV